MNVYIRVDAHPKIGTGHIMRCLNILSYFENKNRYNFYFICKKYRNLNVIDNDLINKIYSKINKKYTILFIDVENDDYILENDMQTWLAEPYYIDANKTISKLNKCKYLIIDHYAIDKNWENIVRNYVEKIIVLEDFIKREHCCDIIINSTINNSILYNNLVNKECKLYLGMEYAIINKETFIQNINNRNNYTISIFVSGSDITDETSKIIYECNLINFRNDYKYTFDVIVGCLNKNYNKIKRFCEENKNFNIYYNIDNMAEILNKSYISIGALGQSLFEKIALNIPSLVLTLSKNQEETIVNLNQTNIFLYIGNTPIDYSIILETNINKLYNTELYNKIKLNCIKFIKNQKLGDII